MGEMDSMRGSEMGRRALLAGAAAGVGVGALVWPHAAGAASAPNGWLDLSSFGASGDGQTDDSGALQKAFNALNAAGGGTLLVNPGIYKIASPVSATFLNSASSIEVVGFGSASQLLLATGSGGTAITVQNAESVTVRDVVFAGTPKQPTDVFSGVRFDSCLQALLRRCDFYGVSTRSTGGAVVYATATDLRIEDCAFRGCGGNSGVQTPVVGCYGWNGLSVFNTDFLDYGYLNGTFMSKTPIAAPFAWIGMGDAAPASGVLTAEVRLQRVKMDEGALFGFACLPNAAKTSRIVNVVVSGLRINLSGFTGTSAVIAQNADHLRVENSAFGYSPSYGTRTAINARGITDVVIDSCRGQDGATQIIADNAVKTLTIRETVYQPLKTAAAQTVVIQNGLAATVLVADGPIAANNLVVASPGSNGHVVAAPSARRRRQSWGSP